MTAARSADLALLDDHQLAAALADDAGRLLLQLRAHTADAWTRRAQGDLQANVRILDQLRAARPDDGILSEEARDDGRRLVQRRVWIVDPLDGTREFGEGRDDWAVHVALAVDGEPAAGAVALPGLGRTLATQPPPELGERPDGPVRLVVSRTRAPGVAVWLAQQLEGELLAMGSAGAKAMAVVLGFADVYAHAGGQYEWDSAAPVAVAAAAGCHVSRLDGSPLRYNRPDPYLPDVLVCRPELAPRVTALLGH